jgi:hypothetical protein
MLFIIIIGCLEQENTSKNIDTGISSPTFDHEEFQKIEPDISQCQTYMITGIDRMMEGSVVEMYPPVYPYEVRGMSIQILIDDAISCPAGGSLHLFTYVGDEEPQNNDEIISFMLYNSIAPYSFPELENIVSTTVNLDSTSNPEYFEELEIYEFMAMVENPLLVEEEQRLWVGFGIHNVAETCVMTCPTNNTSYFVQERSFNETDYSANLGVVIGY